MLLSMMKGKIHRAKVTYADINYEGSITIDRRLCERAGILEHEQVDVYNISNGARLTTYAIYGGKGVIGLNGAAARLAQKGDLVIIVAYALMEKEEAARHRPKVVKIKN